MDPQKPFFLHFGLRSPDQSHDWTYDTFDAAMIEFGKTVIAYPLASFGLYRVGTRDGMMGIRPLCRYDPDTRCVLRMRLAYELELASAHETAP